MKRDVILLLIGALISIISSLVGFYIQLFSEKFIKNYGEVRIYKKLVFSKQEESTNVQTG